MPLLGGSYNPRMPISEPIKGLRMDCDSKSKGMCDGFKLYIYINFLIHSDSPLIPLWFGFITNTSSKLK